MNIRWNIFLSVVAVALLAWFYSLNQEDEKLASLIKAPDAPEYVGQNMQTTVFSPTGKKQYIASAQKVEYYTADGHTDFQQPEVLLLDVELDKKNTEKQTALEDIDTKNNEKQNWNLRADKAKLTKDNMLYLEGNVVVKSLSKLSRLQRIETQSAVVNLKTQDISSDQMVTINGLGFSSSGLKLSGNLQQQVATLKEQVRTRYEISQ